MRLKEALELCRAPNVFTAPADVAMGLAVSGACLGAHVAPLFFVSALAYAGGMALNDACDADLDAVERPKRPIPSGRTTREAAYLLAAGLLGGCMVLARFVSVSSFLVAMALVVAIVVYDVWAKGTFAGPFVMASCRALDVGLGLSAGHVSWRSLLPAVVLFLYILVLTVVSRFEVMRAPLALVRAARVAFGLLFVLAGVIAFSYGAGNWAAVALLGALMIWLGIPFNRASADPSPKNIIGVIKAGVLGVILLDAAMAAGARGLVYGLGVAVLFVPAYLLGRRFASA